MSPSTRWFILSNELHKKLFVQIHVSQNAADNNSPLSCTPDCPQDEAGDDDDGGSSNVPEVRRPAPASSRNRGSSGGSRRKPSGKRNQSSSRNKVQSSRRKSQGSRKQNTRKKPGNSGSKRNKSRKAGGSGRSKVSASDRKKLGNNSGCPGSTLEKCVEFCPGKFGPKVYGACVKTCGKRC